MPNQVILTAPTNVDDNVPIFTDNPAFDENGFFHSAFYEAFTQLSIHSLFIQLVSCLLILVGGILAIRKIRARILTEKNNNSLFASFMRSVAGWILVVVLLGAFLTLLTALKVNEKYMFIHYFTIGGALLLMVRFFAWLFIIAMRPNDLLRLSLKIVEWFFLCSIVLSFFGLYIPLIAWEDSISFNIGIQTINLGKVLSILALALILFAAVGQFSRLVSIAINKQVNNGNLKSNVGELIIRIINIILFVISSFSILTNSGLTSSSIATFTSALGIGLGFGLQKIVINFLSGINVLIEGIVRKDDQIRIGNIAGKVVSVRSQHIVVLEGSGIESIIPNSQLTDTSFQNLTLTDNKHCVKFPVQLSSFGHFEIFKTTIIQILQEQPRILKDGKIGVEVTSIYENICNTEVFFWIADIENGTSEIVSAILVLAGTKLEKNVFATKT